MRIWRRVEPVNGSRLVAGAFFALGLLLFLFVAATMLSGSGRWVGDPVGGSLILILGALFWLTVTFRMYRAGIHVSDHGLRLRSYVRTRTIRWSDVTGFEVRPAQLGGLDTSRDAIWVITRDGDWETSVQRALGWVFGPRWTKNVGPVLRSVDFELTVTPLRRLLADHRSV
ncbi:hypothetical protein R8Z50_11210 [Longispora sp. K20-0274]|uniref:PH domain-containing protein n=1 Tax=Longispora sp. K20-0274 TaxID=3088255 RepID=UPI0039997AE9